VIFGETRGEAFSGDAFGGNLLAQPTERETPVTRFQSEITAPLAAQSARSHEADEAPWGSCSIVLLADRVASLHAGSTHKVYRGWRLAATMEYGHPEPGTPLFAIPVDPGHTAPGQSRYLLTLLADRGAGSAQRPSTFSWSIASLGASDPFAAALLQARQNLEYGGWTQNAVVSTRYDKTGPAGGVRERPEVAGLDGSETEGGSIGAPGRSSPVPRSENSADVDRNNGETAWTTGTSSSS
jgi:hypothetical protein